MLVGCLVFPLFEVATLPRTSSELACGVADARFHARRLVTRTSLVARGALTVAARWLPTGHVDAAQGRCAMRRWLTDVGASLGGQQESSQRAREDLLQMFAFVFFIVLVLSPCLVLALVLDSI